MDSEFDTLRDDDIETNPIGGEFGLTGDADADDQDTDADDDDQDADADDA